MEIRRVDEQKLKTVSSINTVREMCATSEIHHGKCTWHNRTLKCHEAIFDTTSIQFHRLMDTEEIIFCGWPNETFDPYILEKISKLNKFHFENSGLVHIERDFPHLKHLKVGSYFHGKVR